METKIIPQEQRSSQSLEERIGHRIKVRGMSADDFVEKHGSGTLRKNRHLGMSWKDQYLSERIAYEFGWEFSYAPRSRIMTGDAYTEGDCSAITEAGWHMERYLNLSLFPEDIYKAQYIHVEERDGTRREGIGLVVEQTSAPFIPCGSVVYALIAEYHLNTKQWGKAKNPF